MNKFLFEILAITVGFIFFQNSKIEKPQKFTIKKPLNIAHASIGFKQKIQPDSLILRDSFVDSTSIGNKGKNKLEATIFQTTDRIFIQISFYTFTNKNWKIKNRFEFEKDGISGIDPKISDFNTDSYSDFHYKAMVGGRGSNDIRRLFIYDHIGDSLIYMKNSIDYPNIVYNEKLDCIDAWMFHGCSSQAFLRIENDSLIDFAWIRLNGTGISISEVDKNGKEKEILSDTINQYGCFTRFISYKPLIEYEQYYGK